MKDKETPLKLVRLWEKMAPGCYNSLDNCYRAKSDGEISWPDYCPLPIAAAATYLVSAIKLTDREAAMVCAELTACWAWRRQKVIYRFDRDIASALSEQAYGLKDTDVLPADALFHLPYPCVYIKAPGVLEHTDGFWAWVEYDLNRQESELRIQWVAETMDHSFAQVMHLIPGATIGDCVIDTAKTTQEHTREPVDLSNPADSCRIILMAIQLLLYLTADNADVEDDEEASNENERDSVQTQGGERRKDGKIKDKASEIHTKNVGVRIGSAFRRSSGASKKASGSGVGSPKRPHMRRGHWHHYWRGPKSGQRELVLLWTPPAMIHGDSADDAVTVYPVKSDR